MNLTGNLDLTKIVKVPLPLDQYSPTAQTKSQIVAHHSAGWDNARGMFAGWAADKYRVATSHGLIDDGTLFEAFDSKFWASHVGYWINDPVHIRGNQRAYDLCPGTNNQYTNLAIEQRTIGIEVCNWGNLTLKPDGKFYSWANAVVRPDKVLKLDKPFRGFQYFEALTDKELETLWKWIRHQCKVFGIPAKFDGNFDLNANAIRGVPGVYLHTNFRADKSDFPPSPKLAEMLKAL